MTNAARAYVSPEFKRGVLIAYCVSDTIGGMTSQHERFEVGSDPVAALALANTYRDERNAANGLKALRP